MKKRKSLVACYPLRSVLTAEQWAAAEPFARGTFSETWAECAPLSDADDWSVEGARRTDARLALYGASSEPYKLGPDGGRLIEAALYTRAVALGIAPVMHEGRR